MTYAIPNEESRIPVALQYIADQIKEIDRMLFEYDYYEDPDGNMVYSPFDYLDEKCELKNQRAILQMIQDMLTEKTPRTYWG